MASKKKTKVSDNNEPAISNNNEPVINNDKPVITTESEIVEPEIKEVKKVKNEKTAKFNIGDIVFLSKDAEADLNGFKLFPQYKKYTYTVEAYDEISDVYSLRRLNLSLKIKGEFILAPNERAHDSLNRKQF